MRICIVPVRPARSPVPESGTTVTLNCGTPRVMLGAMLQGERTTAALQDAGDALHGDVAARSLALRHEGEHLALALGLEVAVELLIDRHAAQFRDLGGWVVGLLRQNCYFEWSCYLRHL